MTGQTREARDRTKEGGDVARPQGDLLRELEHERRARRQALAEAESQRRFAQALDRLTTAAVTSQKLEELLQGLLDMFIEATRVGIAVVRLREGERLRSRAAVGLEDEVVAGFSLPVVDAFAGKVAIDASPIRISCDETDAPCRSDIMRTKGVRALHCLPLLDGDDLVGVVYMASLEDLREFSDDENRVLAALSVKTAVTVRRHQDHETLKDAIQSRDDVLAVVAHDLRNPISVVHVAAEALLSRVKDLTKRRMVEQIVNGARRAERLIRDLLDVDAIERGSFTIEKRPVEMTDMVLAAIDSQQSLAARASVILAADLSPELPAVQGDAERLLEVLENLVGNSLKFTSRGGSVTVGASSRENEVLVWIKDSGSGILPEQLPYLFDRFWQARRGERKGTGLGLTICKAIIEAHGGRIWAESTVGVGTTISFAIPAASRQPATTTTKMANILLVDDRPENLLSLRAILERPDYRLVTAMSGEEALSLALRSNFSVALIDISMPGMNGLDVALHLKELERSRDIPIIFITAFGDDPDEIHRAYAAGGADYLVKPLDPEIVRKKVAVFVDLTRRRQGAEHSRTGT
jgi:signal transduction histidine kinase/CheY-like chemotaxis protein